VLVGVGDVVMSTSVSRRVPLPWAGSLAVDWPSSRAETCAALPSRENFLVEHYIQH
jgi:hypothetical protein